MGWREGREYGREGWRRKEGWEGRIKERKDLKSGMLRREGRKQMNGRDGKKIMITLPDVRDSITL